MRRLYKKLSIPTKELAELICAAPEAEQKALRESVDAVMVEAYARKEDLFKLVKFRGFDLVVWADYRGRYPALFTIEQFAKMMNAARREIVGTA